jgi:hypothetical protein
MDFLKLLGYWLPVVLKLQGIGCRPMPLDENCLKYLKIDFDKISGNLL